MIGYDFNGVVDTGKFRVYPDDVIITGNTYHVGVMDQLRDMNIKARVYFLPEKVASSNAAAVWKCEMIRRLGVEKFYEDDPIQQAIIKDACPGCEVIRV